MCGICGYLSKKEINRNILVKMTDAMIRRGPDGSGTIQKKIGKVNVGLGHRRLSIVDLSDNGKQPMFSEDGKYVIVYNGEVYNFQYIRTELKKYGYQFQSNCDTEVVLNAFRKWGIKSFDKFNGMFAFAILDLQTKRLILCRDRLGVKPLYYYQNKGEFCFGSDLASIMKYPFFEKNIDPEALHVYLWNMYIPSPMTVFKNTYKLEPGNWMEIDLNTGNIKKESWWHPYSIFESGNIKLQENEWLDRIERNLIDAVKFRMQADVSVGVFLSGGIDSSLVTALACETCNNKNIKTFSIGFNERQFNEAVYAKDIADYFDTDHQCLYCSMNDAKRLVREIPKAYSEPFADNSQIPMLLLSKLTKENVTVALSGDGGDELFFGYPFVSECNRLYHRRWVSKIVRTIYKPASFGTDRLYSHLNWKIEKIRNAVTKQNIRSLDYMTAENLVNSMILYKGSTTRIIDIIEKNLPNVSFIEQMLLKDIRYGLPDDMLTKVDRATMHYSIEARAPLLDYRVAEDAIRMPLDIKCKDNNLKYVLKKILYKRIPEKIVNRPKKGFGIPINNWLRNKSFMSEFQKYFDIDKIRKQGIFSNDGILRMMEFFEKSPTPILDRVVWNYINFQMWWEEYIE